MPFATIQNASIHYETQGEGPPIVFVHGLGGTGNVWHAQRVALSRYFKVITMDLTGSGRSDKNARTYSLEQWADDVAGLIDHLQLDQAVVVGHSMATAIVQKFAARHGMKAKAIVLAGAWWSSARLARRHSAKRAELVEKEGMFAVADTVLAGALSAGTREANPALTGMVREMLLSNCPKCYAGHCRALINGSAKADQASIKCPVLLIVGDQDPVTPLSLQRQIAQAIPHAKIRIVPNTAHLTMLECPAAFNQAVLEFLATV